MVKKKVWEWEAWTDKTGFLLIKNAIKYKIICFCSNNRDRYYRKKIKITIEEITPKRKRGK